MWTQFWDMHSGGGLKEDWDKIYIEANEDDAKIIFYNRFGHNPERVTCTCCGQDYSIDSHESLEQLTGFHRGCNYLKAKDENKRNPIIEKNYYAEDGDKAPDGYVIEKNAYRHERYTTLEEYKKKKNLLFIHENEITPEERLGEIPEQGYVWVD